MNKINVEHHYLSENNKKEKEKRSREIYLTCVRILNKNENIYYKNKA